MYRKSRNKDTNTSDTNFPNIKKKRVTAANGDYRSWLKSILTQRKKANSSYSLRAFARSLGLAPSRISQILNGKQGLSRDAASKVCEKLNLTPDEAAYFCLLVESQDSRSKLKRSEALTKLKALRSKKSEQGYNPLSEQQFSPISDWYYFAILELLSLPSVRMNVEWIAHTLRISDRDASQAIQKLKQFGFIEEKQGKWIVNSSHLSTAYNVPSAAVRKFNHQILEKAAQAIDEQNVLERDISSLILKLDSHELPRFKKILNEFRRDFDNEAGQHLDKNPQRADSIYALSISLFKLTNVAPENMEDRLDQ